MHLIFAPIQQPCFHRRLKVLQISCIPQQQPFGQRAAKDRKEPDSAIVIFCCVRSQREKCSMSEKIRAAAQRFNRPFVDVAA